VCEVKEYFIHVNLAWVKFLYMSSYSLYKFLTSNLLSFLLAILLYLSNKWHSMIISLFNISKQQECNSLYLSDISYGKVFQACWLARAEKFSDLSLSYNQSIGFTLYNLWLAGTFNEQCLCNDRLLAFFFWVTKKNSNMAHTICKICIKKYVKLYITYI